MTQQPKVSVIVPVYGVEKQLPRCIESLLAQTYENIEILLVDDGSRDASGRICDEYAAKDNRIKVFHKENGGLPSARNFAIPLISGEYFMFLDSDDSLEPEAIKTCFDKTENGKYDVVCFGFRHFLEREDSVEFIRDERREPIQLETQKALFEQFVPLSKSRVLGFVTDKLIRTSCVQKNGVLFDPFFKAIGEDGPFILDLLPHLHNFRVIEECFYNYYRREVGSVTLAFRPGAFDCYYERLKRTYAFMQKNNCVDRSFLLDLYCSNILWTYESMFAPSCQLSLKERKQFLRVAFEKPELFSGFQKEALVYAKTNFSSDFSSGSRFALSCILKKKIFPLTLCHWVQLFKWRRVS